MMSPPDRSPERDAAIEAMLPNVPFEGWTRRALADPDDASLFPGGAVEMIAVFSDLGDRRMEEAAAGLTETRLSRRVRAIIALRLEQDRPFKEAIRRAASVLALPGNARAAAGQLARAVDTIWHAAGDQSADLNWYTKRAILAGVYAATVLYWLRDGSEDDADTLGFLDRRLAGVGRVGKLRARADRLLERLPRPPGFRAA